MALINGWYIQHPPWMQVDQRKNNAGEFTPGWEGVEATCRTVLELRMRLVPYLHAAFVRYRRTGLPPFRALVLDYPNDTATWPIDSQYLVGDSLLVAPVFAGQAARPLYLPEGEWFDFWTGQRFSGKQRIEVKPPLEQIPLFVKSGTILPLAQPSLHIEDPASWKLEARAYGTRAVAATLYEDDGSWEPPLMEFTLTWDADKRTGSASRSRDVTAGPRYEVVRWDHVDG